MNKNKISTLIFDFDGTLADTLPNSFNAFQTVFETYEGNITVMRKLKACSDRSNLKSSGSIL